MSSNAESTCHDDHHAISGKSDTYKGRASGNWLDPLSTGNAFLVVRAKLFANPSGFD
jgi:hypothetical protein